MKISNYLFNLNLYWIYGRFIAFWSYISITDVFGYLIKTSDTIDNAYSLIYQSLFSNEHILLFDTMKNFVIALLVAISVIFLIGIVVDNDPFLFANAIRKTKVRLVVVLVIIEVVQVLFIFFAWKYFNSFGCPSDKFERNDQVSTTSAQPTHSDGFTFLRPQVQYYERIYYLLAFI